MKIALIVPRLHGPGRYGDLHQGMIRGCLEAGDEIEMFAMGGSILDDSWREGLPFTELKSRHSGPARHISYLGAMAGEMRRLRPDVVVVMYTSSLLVTKLSQWLFGWKAPVVSWVHFAASRINQFQLLRLADGHVAISSGIAAELQRRLKAPASRVFVAFNGTNVQTPSIRASAADRPVRIAYVGRLNFDKQKRVNDILTAAAKLHGDFHLVIAGDGPDREQLHQFAKDLGLQDRISWLGWQADPWAAVAPAQVLVMASAFEGFPMALIEAMARGLPCLSTDCETGPSDIITPGENGRLYPVGDTAALARLMQEAVDAPERLPAAAAVQASVQKFSEAASVDSMRRALQSVIAATA